jgi:hypothetical protein
MNQYLFLRRMRAPILLLVFGITAILAEYTNIGYGESWPLYLIALGILKLAENAILAQNPPPPPGQYPDYPPAPGYGNYPGYGYGPTGQPAPATASQTGTPTTTAIVPSPGEDRS